MTGSSSATDRVLWLLVHGTFAPGADWIRADSAMAIELAKVPDVDVANFVWSGRNSGLARHRAAVELAKLLDDAGPRYAAVSMVGHSHGGNVMRLAAELTRHAKVTQMVFLGTPFINAQVRDVSGLRRAAVVSLVLSLLLIPWNVFADLLFSGGLLIDLSVLDPLLLTLLFLVSIAALSVTGLVAWQSARARTLFPNTLTRTRQEDHIFQVVGDEAGTLLRSVSFFPNVGYRILQFLSNVAIVAGKHWWTPVWVVPLGFLALFLEQNIQRLRLPLDALVLLLLSTTMSLVILLTFGAIWLVFSAAMRFTPLAFGYEGFASLLSLTLRVGQAPGLAEADRSSHFLVRFPASSGSGLRHSRFYNDERIIAMIGQIAAGQNCQPPEGLVRASPVEAPPRLEPRKWSPFAWVALLFGILVYPLFTFLANPSLAEMTSEEVGFECELGGRCIEIDPAVADAPFESGCTVQPDGSCTFEPAQDPLESNADGGK